MIAWGFFLLELKLCCLHVWSCLSQVLIIRISQQTSSWPNPISKLMPFRFWSFGWDSFWFVWMIFICLGFDSFWLCFGQQKMVHKTWDDGKEQNCCQDYKTFPLLTTITSKSVIINDSHGAKKTCICISHWRSSWIPTKKLKTRTNVSAFKPSWTYVCDGRHLRKCSKQRQAQAWPR